MTDIPVPDPITVTPGLAVIAAGVQSGRAGRQFRRRRAGGHAFGQCRHDRGDQALRPVADGLHRPAARLGLFVDIANASFIRATMNF